METLDLGLMLALGFASSLHCTTMCGPIIAVASAPLGALPSTDTASPSHPPVMATPDGSSLGNCRGQQGCAQTAAGGGRFGGRLAGWQFAYHAGRGIGYALIGMLLGAAGVAIGSLFASRAVGGWIQLLLGVGIVAVGLLELRRPAVYRGGAGGVLTRGLRRLVTSGHGLGMFGLGLLTALLPCGVLYVAFARAVTAGSALGGGLAMLAFWAGTVPLLAAVGLVSGHAFRRFGRLAPVLLAVAMTVTGGWLVFKGQRNLSSLAQAGTASPPPVPHHR